MENVTIILQGIISQHTLNFYIEHYPTANVIISTWVNVKLNIQNIPSTYNVILSKLPKDKGPQNMHYQILSTLNGLRFTKTDHVIKIRGDEYYSNIEYIVNEIGNNPKKIYCSPVFFRHWSHSKFHISDHIIAGTTDNLKLMFEKTKFYFKNNMIYNISENEFKLGIKYQEKREFEQPKTIDGGPEESLTRSYLMAKEGERWGKVDGRLLMVDNFEILNVEELSPFRMISNGNRVHWDNSFIPEKNKSISNINQLLLSKEEVYGADIS
tara:strand:- start:65 stop:868 length:804 start_codon:yes stop_codon:yes gene_type:complete